jgi:hypothetical protein
VQLVIGIAVYREDFSHQRAMTFLFIWIGLALYTADNVWTQRSFCASAEPPLHSDTLMKKPSLCSPCFHSSLGRGSDSRAGGPEGRLLRRDRKGRCVRQIPADARVVLERAKAGPIGVLFLGDSITEGWAKAPHVWERYYAKLQPANFGIGGDRTEHVIWRIENGELDGIHPKVVVLMIGTNNSADYSGEEIAAANQKIIGLIHAKIPDAKVLLLAIFPRDARRNPRRPDHRGGDRRCRQAHERNRSRQRPPRQAG